MCKRLLDSLGKKSILYDKQLGFRASYSTDQAFLSILIKSKGELMTFHAVYF